MLRRSGNGASAFLALLSRGTGRGLGYWTGTFRSLLRSRHGLRILLIEVLVLAMLVAILWSTWRGQTTDPFELARAFLIALPAALIVVYLLPALAFVGGSVVWEVVRALQEGFKTAKRKTS
jgi:uncharacterized membrane protein